MTPVMIPTCKNDFSRIADISASRSCKSAWHLVVHLLDKGLQLAVQFRIAAGKAVGIFRQTMALGTLLRYHITVQCVEHRGGRRRRCFLFLAEQPEKTFPPLFLRLFLPARLHYHRHLLGYPAVDVRLLFQSLHDGAQPLFLVLQQVAHAASMRTDS